ncbi:MAG: tRNA (N6-isopentenyl adenosine(37)-C2)-methylthiotransferase MiaB [Bacteroidia bacterium]|nr:MAG: tRNA (N6-isopentenyl adenosine(37)-C2)-methylthiotransferase MiaB [Bacteroidia bacterium]
MTQSIDLARYITSGQRIRFAEQKCDAPRFYIQTYGCQMNVADSEVISSVMLDNGYALSHTAESADIIFINTCAIRDNAEQRIRNKLQAMQVLKKKKKHLIVGLLGCMAERLKEQLLEEEKILNLVAGPDAYRSLPKLVKQAETGSKAINVLLSAEETYADISPVRRNPNNVSAFVSITRGCDNMCAFCVVPYTRGRERSRRPGSILREVMEIRSEGYKEITLLGQNVDKYNWNKGEVSFARLLQTVAENAPDMRLRFATSYPQNFTDEVIEIMAKYPNICKYIHLPVQSGSNSMLRKMRRGYTVEKYMKIINNIRRAIPDCAISTDIIAGYCAETEEDHQATLQVMREVGYDFAYMFKYSERPNTYAQKHYEDDIDEADKTRRLNEIIALQQELSLSSNQKDIGKTFEVLVEGKSKKSDLRHYGRNSQNKVIVFPKENSKIGDYVQVKVEKCTSATLTGTIVSSQK